MGLGKFVKNVGLPVGLALATGQPWLAAPAVTNLLGQKEADDEKKRREKQAKRDAALRAFGGTPQQHSRSGGPSGLLQALGVAQKVLPLISGNPFGGGGGGVGGGGAMNFGEHLSGGLL
tara:strand:+ start:203 stop:559 length:357 start_codon:yes stop_codon:yes gene_type:complete